MDIRTFKQTSDSFIDSDGRNARDVFKEAVKESTSIPVKYKRAAYDYFVSLESEAMKYDLSGTPDLVLSLNYQSGVVILDGDGHFDTYG